MRKTKFGDSGPNTRPTSVTAQVLWEWKGEAGNIIMYSFAAISLKGYATISVPSKVKQELEGMKKDKEWSEFLAELAHEVKILRSRKAFRELSELLSEEELDRIEECAGEFREGLKLR